MKIAAPKIRTATTTPIVLPIMVDSLSVMPSSTENNKLIKLIDAHCTFYLFIYLFIFKSTVIGYLYRIYCHEKSNSFVTPYRARRIYHDYERYEHIAHTNI